MFNWEDDIKQVMDNYPLLVFNKDTGIKKLIGKIELFNDKTNKVFETYDIKIYYPENFPYCFPKVYETGNKIPRKIERHVFPNKNNLCFAVKPEEDLLCLYGISTLRFIDNILVPKLAEEFIINKGGKYIHEYSHDSNGIWEYYMKKLNLQDPYLVINAMKILAKNNYPKGHLNCFCGSGQTFKKYHRKNLLFLSKLGKEYYNKIIEYLINHPFKD